MCEGEAPSDNPPFHSEGWLADSSEEVRHKVWMGWVEQMSKIHKVTVDSKFDFLSSGKDSRPLDDDLSYYKEFYDWAIEGESHSVLEETIGWLE